MYKRKKQSINKPAVHKKKLPHKIKLRLFRNVVTHSRPHINIKQNLKKLDIYIYIYI
jgi:hypothetical protein